MQTAIAIFAYKRPAHLSRVLKALEPQLKNEHQGIPIFIFIDGPRSSADEDAVRQTRQVAYGFSEARSSTIYASDINKGLYSSLTEGVSAVLREFESIIVLEDDIVTSTHFLRYMIAGLNRYRFHRKVASIHGYCPPIRSLVMPENFFLRGADCWGWATWRDRWKLFNCDAQGMADSIDRNGLAFAFNLDGYYDFMALLRARANGKSNSWAICWHASCFLAGLYTMHPGRSLVKNIGLDFSGEHCSPDSWMDSSIAEGPVRIIDALVEEDPSVRDAYCKQVGGPHGKLRAIRLKIKAVMYYMWFRFFKR